MTKRASSFTEFVVEQDRAPWWFAIPQNNRLITSLITMPADVATQAMVDGAKASMAFRDHDGNEDFLPLVADASNALLRYSNETTEQFRQRLAERWDLWVNAGSPAEMVRQLAAAGYPDCMIQRDFGGHLPDVKWGSPTYQGSVTGRSEDVATTSPNPFSFVLVVPNVATAPVLDTNLFVGAFNVGQTNPVPRVGWASEIVTWSDVDTITGIVRQFKPNDFICSAIVLLGPASTNTYYLPNPATRTDSEFLWRAASSGSYGHYESYRGR